MGTPLWSLEGGPFGFGGAWADGRTQFRVGKDSVEDSWPAFHPGPLNASTGWRPHRAEITFDIEEFADMVLQLRFAAGHGPCPDIEIELDGVHRGLFHPEVRRDTRDTVYRHGPIAGDVELDIALPASWLSPGEHVLALTTALDSAAATGGIPNAVEQGRHREQYGIHFGSGITWHSLALAPSATVSTMDVELLATPLYLDETELLELTVTVPPDTVWPDEAVVIFNGVDHTLDLRRDGRTFGQVRVRFGVEEFEGSAEARVSIGDMQRTFSIRPARKWTVHLIPHVHLDVGYTDYQGKVLELHSRNLDRALAALDADPDFAFSVDGSVILKQYIDTRSPGRADRVLAALRSGRLSVNAFHSLFLSGVTSLEETYRAAYLTAGLRDEHGVPVTYANLTDVPSYSAAVPSMLAALGIDAFVGIENHHRGGNADTDTQHLLSPMMWEGVDGSRVLAHFSDTYSQLRFMAADPQTIAGAAHSLCRFTARYERDDYLPHDLPVIGTHADNEDLADGDASFAARWNAVYSWPRMVVSTMEEYLATVRPLADRLPVWRGDGGSYWEDGVGTGAAIIAEHRQAQTALLAAESLSALVANVDDTYRPNRTALDSGWEGSLYGCEHTWTWSHGTAHPHGEQVDDQLDWKRHQVHTAHRVAHDETLRALSQLGELVKTDGPTLLVYNPLGWASTVDVETEAQAGTPFFLDGQQLPSEVLSDCAGLHRFRITVPDVPAFGYRALRVGEPRTLAPGEEGGASAITEQDTNDWQPAPDTLTTDRWEATLDNGTITSLVHRPSGRAVLDTNSPWRLGQVLHVLNGPDSVTRGSYYSPHTHGHDHSGEPHRHTPGPRDTLWGRFPGAQEPDLDITSAELRPIGVLRTFDGWRIRTVGSAPSLPFVEVDVLLRDTDDKVDVTVRLDKERVLTKESVYIAFPFSADNPRIRYDRQQGWINPAIDHAPGACNEWFTTQYGVAVDSTSDGPAVAWTSADAPLFTVSDIVRGTWAREFTPTNGTVFSWVLNNYWPTNTPPEQDGSLTLHYSFAPLPNGFEPAAASRFGLRVRNTPVSTVIGRLDKYDHSGHTLPAEVGSLADLGIPDHVHATLAGSKDGNALLLRVQNLTGQAQTIWLNRPHGKAFACYADEREIDQLTRDKSGRIRLDLHAWQVATVKLHNPA